MVHYASSAKRHFLVQLRPTSLTARALQTAGLIRYHRGELIILDRAGLEEASCEWFGVTTRMYDRMMQLP
jgi:hypothetical protein